MYEDAHLEMEYEDRFGACEYEPDGDTDGWVCPDSPDECNCDPQCYDESDTFGFGGAVTVQGYTGDPVCEYR